jgi:hypothetical protein
VNSTDAFFVGAVGTAIEHAIRFDAMPDNLAIAMVALRSQRMNGALKAIKEMGFTIPDDFDGFVVIISANFALNHNNLLVDATYERNG